MSAIRQSDAARELLQRREIRRSFSRWCEYSIAPMRPAKHHRLIISALDDILNCRTPEKNIMLFLPPGSAKSTYASDLFPPYAMTRGNIKIIGVSNTDDLAKDFSRRVRSRILQSGPILGYGLDREEEGLWSTTNGCAYKAAGAGATITGFRADIAVLDDLIRGRLQANSETQRDKLWHWFHDDFRSRLKPQAITILINTRWHQDDISGRLLDTEGADWKVISIPAECNSHDDPLGRKIGQFLWEDDDYGYAEAIRQRKKRTPAATWNSLYQQSPTAEEGDYFRKDWLIPYKTAPKNLSVYGASDYATKDGGGDWTVHIVVGVDPDGELYLLDLWRDQTTPDVWISAFCGLVKRWGPIEWAEESGQILSSVGSYLKAAIRKSGAYTFRRQFASKADKSQRAQSIRGRMAERGLHVPKSAPWYPAFEAELLSCWSGKHDDQADALGLVGQLLDHVLEPDAATDERKKQPAVVPINGGAIIDVGRILEEHRRARREDRE